MLAAIQAELVDVRNIGFNKSIKLTLHVPAERAAEVLKAFGWPTAIDPVLVAVARLVPQTVKPETDDAQAALDKMNDSKWMAQRAALLCGSGRFQIFVGKNCEADAADSLRARCGVETRADIRPGTPAGDKFLQLLNDYEEWLANAR